jgi:hypothetical protein
MQGNLKLTVLLLCVSSVLILALTPSKHSLSGHWVSYYGNGQKINYDFRSNGTVKVEIPAESFTVEGKYKLKNDILSLNDGTCGLNYWGTYKETFLSEDSIYSALIDDSCGPRKSAVNKAVFIRVK